MKQETAPSKRTRVKRMPERGIYDAEVIHDILDEALMVHVGFGVDGKVSVIPTLHWRIGHRLFIHGSAASRMIRILSGGAEACLTVSLLDGLVLARSAFHHSVNYRSVVCYARAIPVEDPEEKKRCLGAMMEKLFPGRQDLARAPNEQELKATAVLAFDLGEASAKIRTGPPVDDEVDLNLPIWAGVIPLTQRVGTFLPDPLSSRDLAEPILGPAFVPGQQNQD